MEKKNLIEIYRLSMLIAFSAMLICAAFLYYINGAYSNGMNDETPQAVSGGVIQDYEKAMVSNHAGETLFMSNCGSCHSLSKVKVGPALSGLSQKRSREWIHDFVRNPAKMASKDAAAQALLKKYSPVVMPNQDFLTEAEIDSIIDFIGEAGNN
jgi:mono/diheme cytochrome c family protein